MSWPDQIPDLLLGSLGFTTSILLSAYQPLWSRDSDTLVGSIRPQILLPVLIVCLALYKNFDKLRIWVTGFLLGLAFSLGLQFSDSPFGIYVAVLAFFHFSEFLTTGLTNPQNLSFDSYLVNHSLAYGLAALASWLEFWLEWYWLLSSRSFTWQLRALSLLGLAVCLLGELVRKLAMFHAGRNFNHLVQERRDKEHRLVTTGIYSWCRHPSYAGWFLWSLGSQVILLNPVCFLAYAVVSYRFFKDRIYVEEYNLLSFFGAEYAAYQQRVPTGLPLIPGYRV